MTSCARLLCLPGAALIAVFSGMFTTVAAQQNAAANYPTKPIRWITPYPPGGSTTALSRMVGDKLSEAFGRNVIIDNRPGGNTMTGADAVAKALPDGYTVLLGGNSQVILSLLMKPPFDVWRDFAPVTILAKTNYILVVNPSLPANNLQEFINYAKANPGKLNYGSTGAGGPPHLAVELLNYMAKIKITHIVYKGISLVVTANLSNEIQVATPNLFTGLPHVRGGKLRALGITSAKRSALMSEAPTLKESGLDVEAYLWVGLFANAATPEATLTKVREVVRKSVAEPAFHEAMTKVQVALDYRDGPEFKKFFDADYKRLGPVVKQIGRIEEPAKK